MKKLSLLLLLGIGLISKAQTYIPFPTSNASWIESEFCDERHYEIVGDTVVNGLTYHLLYVNVKFYTQGPTGCFNPFSYTLSGGYAGAFRNDSLNKRVFYLPPNQSSDTLLYDFNLSVGDTLPTTYKAIYNNLNINLSVSRVDSIFSGGVFRKRFTFNHCAGIFGDTLRLIEGIGSNQLLLGAYIICEAFGPPFLHCMKKNGLTLYSDPSGTCQLITSLSKKNSITKEKEISVSPNPTNGKLSISSSIEMERIELYSVSGSRIREVRVDQSRPEESVIFLPQAAGIYFLRVLAKDGSTYSEKIVKQ